MSTLTLVITYTGTVGAGDLEVQSFTHAGTAYGSIAEADRILSKITMMKAIKQQNGDYGATWAPEGDHA